MEGMGLMCLERVDMENGSKYDDRLMNFRKKLQFDFYLHRRTVWDFAAERVAIRVVCEFVRQSDGKSS